jgi:dipeptidyl-peptidase 4
VSRSARRGHLAAYPGLSARTRRFTLGRPRDLRVSPDGRRVLFLRSVHGQDPVNRLWVLDVETGAEHRIADPTELDGAGERDLPPEERARRERARETAAGIVAYATDRAHRRVVFALAGRAYVAEIPTGSGPERSHGLPALHAVDAQGPVVDPRLDPAGRQVAYVVDGALHVATVEDGAGPASTRQVAVDDPEVTWGLAEFVAGEEMGRARGHWWDAHGERMAVARVDNSAVERWYVSAPVDPDRPPAEVAYPAAGTANADVSLWVVGVGATGRVEVRWDRETFPYLARVRWGDDPLTLQVQSRDQRRTRVLVADPETGTTEVIREVADPAWVELVDGVPAWTPDGRLVTVEDDGPARRVVVDGEPVTPLDVQVRRVMHVGPRGVLVAASVEPTEIHVLWLEDDRAGGWRPRWLTHGRGVHGAAAGGEIVVISSARPTDAEVSVEVRPLDAGGGAARGGSGTGRTPAAVSPSRRIASFADVPPLRPDVRFLALGPDELRAALLLPAELPDDRRVPVLLDPYAGPHAQRVVTAGGAHLTSRWFAEHGFAVLVIDGRGTPGRGPEWERAVHRDLAGPVLEDQIAGLRAAAQVEPRLDLGRVAIRGWSFGGTLAALAVLRRPDVFDAAIAGAPVTDWRLYDTHYTERYLGDPREDPAPYLRSSVIGDAEAPADPRQDRPLLLIHGMADDNVVAAHSLRLSRALFESGRRHVFLPLSGVTHMTPQEVVAERLLEVQLGFLRDALGYAG